MPPKKDAKQIAKLVNDGQNSIEVQYNLSLLWGEGGREGGKEGGREGGREGAREREREGEKQKEVPP